MPDYRRYRIAGGCYFLRLICWNDKKDNWLMKLIHCAWGLDKTGFSRQLAKTERINQSPKPKGERGIWQRRYWEYLIKNDNDYGQHVNYILLRSCKI